MPAVSKAQQKFFGIVRAIQKGEMAPTTPETAKAAAEMKKKDVKDFASTKHKGLPNKKEVEEAYYGGEEQRRKDEKKTKYEKQLKKMLPKRAFDSMGRELDPRSGKLKEESNPRIPRKKGQPANSKKHSDLYTDENPKGTIHGLGFKNVATAKASVSKIRNSSRSHAHKIQAAVAMEQRAREMGKTSEAAVYRKYINSMKKKTKKMNEAANPAQQAAIAIDMKKKGKKPKSMNDKVENEEVNYSQKDKIMNKAKPLHKHLFKSFNKGDRKGDVNESRYDRYDNEKREFEKSDSRMKYGKNWNQYIKDAKLAKSKLRPGEVKKYNKETDKWESNKD